MKFQTWAVAKCLVTDRRILLFRGSDTLSLEKEVKIGALNKASFKEHGRYSDITLKKDHESLELRKIPTALTETACNFIEKRRTDLEEKFRHIYKRTDNDLDEIKTSSGEFSPQKDPTSKIRGTSFEYLRLQLTTQDIKSGDKRINELGHAGWELVSVVPTSSELQAFTGSGASQYLHLYFKRPLNNAKKEDEQLEEESEESYGEDGDHLSKIEKLHKLKEDGALTEEEFEEKKKEFL